MRLIATGPRPLAIYTGLLPVVQRDSGGLALGGKGPPIVWLVVMNRFEQAELFDDLANHGQLPLSRMAPLAEQIADYHDQAQTFPPADCS